jgi:hypothetical protein
MKVGSRPSGHQVRLARGTDIRIIQALLDTTARYTRVATGMIASFESPLDLLSQPRKKPKKGRKDQPPLVLRRKTSRRLTPAQEPKNESSNSARDRLATPLRSYS